MNSLSTSIFLNKAKRAYRLERAKDPSLPAPIWGGGWVEPNGGGSYLAVIPTNVGFPVVKRVSTTVSYHVRSASAAEARKADVRTVETGPTMALEAQARTALDRIISLLAELEKRALEAGNGLGARSGNGADPHHQHAHLRGNGSGDGAEASHIAA
jgi:hypothetical protein